jgi:predicted acetyltransferase
MAARLLTPTVALLPGYLDAVERHWSATSRDPVVPSPQTLEAIRSHPTAFLATLTDPAAKGPPITLPDGSEVPRLPSQQFWIWDGGFCGIANLRWPLAGTALPEHVLGHVGYNVVPWRRGKGQATRALALLLPEARRVGLAWIEAVVDTDNPHSEKVILAHAGRLVERFRKPAAYGGGEALRYRIDL